MAGLFNLAADRALHLSEPPQKISVIGMAGGGGLYPLIKRSTSGSISTGSLGSRDPGGLSLIHI